MNRLQGRVALITGASKGLGKRIAFSLGEEGAKLCLLDIDEQSVHETSKEFLEKGLEAIPLHADVSDKEKVEIAVKTAIETYGHIDILVNNAGILRDNLLFKMSDEDWDLVMNVHLTGAFYCTRAVQKYMVENKFGRIITISSTSALGNRGQVNYATAKAGLQGFTKTLAIELGKFGITANAVAPGFIETDMTKQTAKRIGVPFDEFAKNLAASIPAGRLGQPEDIANAVLFFSLEESSYVNGQVLYVAGGPTV
ncbi:3-oxoacyl-ACP reductase FabG [Bacillus sp. FJAT-47783]|uniref:3-oxoacyl-ACP reductase FabG n=1 Tax=Bacillus sp. FJAT-47783 TaxID=2922712 RepID=UPI001FAC6EBA|nr:3-oxoacyl-ACP reductase FabG [Bacillus sp. FJAT-47783]